MEQNSKIEKTSQSIDNLSFSDQYNLRAGILMTENTAGTQVSTQKEIATEETQEQLVQIIQAQASLIARMERYMDLGKFDLPYAKDINDSMRVVISSGTSSTSNYMWNAGTYALYHGTGGPNSMDARELEATQSQLLFETRRNRWNF